MDQRAGQLQGTHRRRNGRPMSRFDFRSLTRTLFYGSLLLFLYQLRLFGSMAPYLVVTVCAARHGITTRVRLIISIHIPETKGYILPYIVFDKFVSFHSLVVYTPTARPANLVVPKHACQQRKAAEPRKGGDEAAQKWAHTTKAEGKLQ